MSKKSKFPETSLEAYRAQTAVKLNKDHQRIIAALKVLGTGTAEQIAEQMNGFEAATAGRRMSELERKGVVFKTGEKRKTKRGHNAFVYCLTNSQPLTDKQAAAEQDRLRKGVSATSDDIKNLIRSKPMYIQRELL